MADARNAIAFQSHEEIAAQEIFQDKWPGANAGKPPG
jgi:hypothetical protein